jgi:hypothetical protein
MPLADWIIATDIGVVDQEMHDQQAEREERNDGWQLMPFLRLMLGRSFTSFSKLKFPSHLFAFLLLICFVYWWGLIPRMGTTHR